MVEERNRKVIEHYLRAWNTQESIGEIHGITKMAVSNVIESSFAKSVDSLQDFKPFIYNIWNAQKQDHETNH